MIDIIYNTPPYILRTLFNVIILSFLFCTSWLVYRYCARNDLDHDAVNGASATVSMMYAVFLGFVIFASVNNLSTATDEASAEAHTVSEISYDASFLRPPLNQEVQVIMKNYLHNVIEQEWPAMQAGNVNNSAYEQLHQLKAVLLANRPANDQTVEINIWTDLVAQAETLHQQHQDRLNYSANLSVNKGVWYCLVVATFVMLISSSFFYFTDRRKNISMLVCIGMITGLLLFLETSINFPYRGDFGVKSDGFQMLLKELS